jgi:hypothetical protein
VVQVDRLVWASKGHSPQHKASTTRKVMHMMPIYRSLQAIWGTQLFLLLACLAMPCCSGQDTASAVQQVRTVKTPSELFRAINDDASRHIVIQAHMNFSASDDPSGPLLKVRLSTKTIQVRVTH